MLGVFNSIYETYQCQIRETQNDNIEASSKYIFFNSETSPYQSKQNQNLQPIKHFLDNGKISKWKGNSMNPPLKNKIRCSRKLRPTPRSLFTHTYQWRTRDLHQTTHKIMWPSKKFSCNLQTFMNNRFKIIWCEIFICRNIYFKNIMVFPPNQTIQTYNIGVY